MDDISAFVCGGCCAAIAANIQWAFCNTRQYGADATCCDNCCRFNCCWKQGALPVEDYPIGNSAPEDRTQSVDPAGKKEGQGGQLPAYAATPQMSVAPSPADVSASGGAPADAKKAIDGQASA